MKCISAGHRHSLCIRESGSGGESLEVWAWGDNSYGQLGLGDFSIRLQPTLLTCSRRTRAMQVSAGERHSAIAISHIPMTWKVRVCLWLGKLCSILTYYSKG